jgi:hypothetical protein
MTTVSTTPATTHAEERDLVDRDAVRPDEVRA